MQFDLDHANVMQSEDAESDLLRAELARYLEELSSRNPLVNSTLNHQADSFDSNETTSINAFSSSSTLSPLDGDDIVTNEDLKQVQSEMDDMDSQIAQMEARILLHSITDSLDDEDGDAKRPPSLSSSVSKSAVSSVQSTNSSDSSSTFFTEIDHSLTASSSTSLEPPSSIDASSAELPIMSADLDKEMSRLKSAMSVIHLIV